MYLLYSALLALALIITSPWWFFQMLRSGKYRTGLAERLGRVPARLLHDDKSPVIWVHAVSVGEVLAVSGLIHKLKAGSSRHRIVVSTTTATGQKLAREKFGAENVFFFPLDFALAIRPYLKALKPELVVIAETEFWPNFLRLVHDFGAKVAVVNARISDRSFPRFRRFRALLSPVLRCVDRFLTQSDIDRGRLLEIGAPVGRVTVSGNLKFDIMPPKATPLVGYLQVAFKRDSATPIIVCGSTVDGEEPIMIESFRRALKWFPKAVMVLAPRHPERWEQVAELLQQSGLPWTRRTQWQTHEPLAGEIFLLDSIGELAAVYQLATVAFVGGSLVPRGGHNILEPAHYATPVIVGPHTENFRDIVELFARSGAVDIVQPDKFADELLHLLDQEEKRTQLGHHAAEVVRKTCGATDRTVEVLQGFLQRAPRAGRKVRHAH